MYSDIGYILGRTYFRDVPHYGQEKGVSYILFYSGSKHDNLDKAVNAKDNKKYLSGTANYWVTNIDDTIVTKSDITAADLLCYNYAVYGKYYTSDFKWFPILYIYENEYDNSISRLARYLVSKEKVQKVLPMFNYDTVEDFVNHFKEIEADLLTVLNRDYRYHSCFESAPLLGSFIKSEEIATVR